MGQGIANYRLTRFGACLVAMAGDDTKATVAEARIYFAVKTREAEISQPRVVAPFALPQTYQDALRTLADTVDKLLTRPFPATGKTASSQTVTLGSRTTPK